MKAYMPLFIGILIGVLTWLLIAFASKPAHADTAFKASLGLSQGVYATPLNTDHNATRAFGSFKISDPSTPIALVGSFKSGFNRNNPFRRDDQCMLGAECSLTHGWVAFVNAERRFRINDNRVFAGIRLDFGGHF